MRFFVPYASVLDGGKRGTQLTLEDLTVGVARQRIAPQHVRDVLLTPNA
jgi:hypothetical protein